MAKNKVSKRSKQQKKPETFMEWLVSWVKTIVGAVLVVMVINGLLIASFVVPTPSMEKTVMTGDFLFVNKFLYGPSTPQVIPFVNVPLPFYKFPGFKNPEVGDVIVFIFPGNRDEVEPKDFQYYLKRCVATAGDTIEVRDKKVYVNGKFFELPETARQDERMIRFNDKALTFPYGRNYTRDNWGPMRVPQLGDTIALTPSNIKEWDVFIYREGSEAYLAGNKVYIDGEQTNKYVVKRDYCFGMGDNRDNSTDSRYFGFIPWDNVVGTPMIVYWAWDTDIPFSNLFEKIKSVNFGRIGTIIR